MPHGLDGVKAREQQELQMFISGAALVKGAEDLQLFCSLQDFQSLHSFQGTRISRFYCVL